MSYCKAALETIELSLLGLSKRPILCQFVALPTSHKSLANRLPGMAVTISHETRPLCEMPEKLNGYNQVVDCMGAANRFLGFDNWDGFKTLQSPNPSFQFILQDVFLGQSNR